VKFLRCGDKDDRVLGWKDYFDSLGYKIINKTNLYDKMMYYVVRDFQGKAHIKVDGIIGPITTGASSYYNISNFCPEVYELIKPYRQYNDEQIEFIMLYRLKGLGRMFNTAAIIYNIDVMHIIAHAVLESNWGRSVIARVKKNLFGFRAYDQSPLASAGTFKSYEDCIMTWTKWWRDYYLVATGKYYNGCHEKGVNVRYATSPIAGINKSFIVRSLRRAVIRNES